MPEIRLIDANALMKSICGHECGCNPEECDGMESETVPCNFYAYVNEAPTIDAHPVKQGKWITTQRTIDDGFTTCSYCHSEFYIDNLVHVGNEDGFCEFCPRCGARMDGDNDVG